MEQTGYLLFADGATAPLPAGLTALRREDVEAALGGRRPNDVVEAALPEGLHTVGSGCFECFEHLRRVRFAPGVAFIDECAFDGCCDLIHALGLQTATKVEPEGNQALLAAIGYFM